jgi:hypothetical protein
MKPARLLSIALLVVLPGIASAQYIWLDKDGRKVFSDRPPPADIAPGKLLKQPATAPKAEAGPLDGPAAGGATTAAASPARAASAAAPKLGGGTDKDLEAKKKQQEQAELEKKKAQDIKVAEARAENCNRAKASKATLDSGLRVSSLNSKGEKEVMDDTQRAQEQKRLADVIARDCK